MKKLTLAATAVAVLAALAGCARHDDNAASTASTSAPSTTAPSSSYSSTSMATAPSTSDTSASIANAPSTSDNSTNLAAAASGSTNPAAVPSTRSTTDPSSSGTVASSSGSSSGADAGSSASSTAVMGAGSSGQTVYSTTCAVCHAAGVTGAPKPGDKADWGPRIAQGNDTLYQHALNGFQGKKGVMPPKGGNTALADADVKAAVDFMVSQSK
jgi:cytochrome c5